MKYYAVVRKAEDSDFGVEFPDFDGCVTAGEDLDEAADMAAEALEFHLAGMEEDGEAPPTPSTLKRVQRYVVENNDDGDFVAVLGVEIEHRSRTVRLNISMDERLLRTIDSFAEEHGKTRSAVLVEAARKYVR